MSVIRPIQYPADKLDRLIHDGIISPPILDKNFAKLRNLGLHDGIPVTFSRASLDTGFDHNLLLRSYASGEAAFDHHPVSGQSYGLQVPAAAAQLETYTEDLTNASGWSAVDCTVLANQAAGPDGTTSLEQITATAAGNRVVPIAPGRPVSASTQYTMSRFVRAGTSNYAGLVVAGIGGTPTTAGAIYDLTGAGAVISTASSADDSGIEKITSDGLYRIWLVNTTGVGQTSAYVGVGVSDGSTYVGVVYPSASSGTIMAGFAQYEAGGFPTSYIARLDATAASRAATSATIALSSVPSLDLTNFTGVWKGGTAAGAGTNQTVMQIDNNGGSQRVAIHRNAAGVLKASVIVGGVAQAVISIGTAVPDNTDFAVACWFKENSFYAAQNVGGTIETANDLAGLMPSGMVTKRFGNSHDTTTPFNGTIAHGAMWNSGSEQFVRQLVS